MNLNEIVTIINSVGFPIFVSCVLLYIIHQNMEKQTKALDSLSNLIEDLKELIKGNYEKK